MSHTRRLLELAGILQPVDENDIDPEQAQADADHAEMIQARRVMDRIVEGFRDCGMHIDRNVVYVEGGTVTVKVADAVALSELAGLNRAGIGSNFMVDADHDGNIMVMFDL